MKTKHWKFQKSIIFLISFFIFALYSSYVFCADYFVATNGSDNNSGSQALPWRTIQKAANAMVAGDKVSIQAGNYSESVFTTAHGTAGKHITFQAIGNVNIKKFQIRHNYIKIDGFSFTTALSNDDMVVQIDGSSNLIVSNNSFTQSGTNDYYAVRCSSYSGSTNILITNNHVYNWQGISFDLHGDNITASFNTVDGFKDDIFRTEALFNSRIANNIIRNGQEIGRHTDFVQVFGDNNYNSYNVIIESNFVADSNIQICMTTNDGRDIRDYTIRNNIFINVGMAAQLGLPGMKVYNNLFWNSGKNTSAVLHIDQNYLRNIEVKNNIFIGCGNASTMNPAYDVAASSINADYNFVAKMPSNGWAQVSSFSEPHGINGGDPNFVDYTTYNFRLKEMSKLIDKGSSISIWASPDDKDGFSRPEGGGWDIGPFEGNGSGIAAPKNVRISN
jgi:hypothetical protein